MNILLIVIIVILAFIGIGLVFKLVKFTLKLLSLAVLLIVLFFLAQFIFQADTSILYVIEGNSTTGIGLDGERYNFSYVYDEEFNLTVMNYSKVYIIGASDFTEHCTNITNISQCFRKESVKSLLQKVK